MPKKITALLLVFVLLVPIIQIQAFAEADTTPPILLSITLTDTDLLSTEDFELYVKASDEVSGLSGYCEVDIAPKGSNESICRYTGVLQDDESGTYIVHSNLDNNTFRSGDYHISSVRLDDNTGNSITYSNANGLLPDKYYIHFTNDVKTDWEPPVIKSVTTDKKSYSVGEIIHFTVYTQDSSEVILCELTFNGLNRWINRIELNKIPYKPGYFSGTYTVPSTMPQDSYSVMVVRATDQFLNRNNYFIEDDSPSSLKCSFIIVNSSVSPSHSYPIVTAFSMSQNVRQGEPIKISITVNPNGRELSSADIRACYVTGSMKYDTWVSLAKQSGSLFTGELTPPVNWSPGSLYLYPSLRFCDIFGSYNIYATWPSSFYDIYRDNLKKSICKVACVFIGTENAQISLGRSFNPLDGVNAQNSTEGDMTSRIECMSAVDTSKVGVYLVKYRIPTTIGNSFDGQPSSFYYDFRWVGVTEAKPDSSAGSLTLVVTNDTVGIGAESGDVLLTKNGASVAYASGISAPGSYTISLKDGSGGKSKAGFIIDHAGPSVNPSWVGVYPSTIAINANSTDPSGVTETKWMKGSVALATIKATGTVFDKKFTVGSLGTYTIYARDAFGYESTKTFNIPYVGIKSVSMSTRSAKVLAGKTLQLKASVSPSNATYRNVIWKSSNPKVATVDANGLVRALAKGTVKITAKAADGGKYAVCTVQVNPPIAVRSVSISRTSKSLKVGDSLKLKASVRPSNATVKTITWASSNTAIAVVDTSGKVRAVGVGTAYITAKAGNGKSARCKVVVKPVAVTSLRLNKTTATMTYASALQLSVTLKPSNATYKTIAWTSTNKAVAVVDGTGRVLALSRGTAYIYAKTNNGKYSRCLITVK